MAARSCDPGVPAWLGPAALAGLFLALLAWSWRKWTDVHIDFGNELYIAWQLSLGKALYRDIAHRNGPLSHYWNALLFLVFGVSIRTLVLANLAVLVAICGMVWRIFREACDRTTATLAVGVLLCVFAFGQYAGIANFNYVTPYHHFQTHGLALSLVMLLLLGRAARTRGRAPLVAAGTCLGAVFLTKAELFVPALAAAVAAFAARAAGVWGARGRGLPDLAGFAAGSLAPPTLFAVVLGAQMPLPVALGGVLGNWAHLGGVSSDPFYRSGAGLEDVAGNAARVGRALLAIAGFGVLAAAADRAAHGLPRRAVVAIAAGAGLLALLVVFSGRIPWMQLARALPVTSVAAVLWLGRGLRRDAREARDAGDGRGDLERGRSLVLFLFSVYATALLAKLGLAARFYQYGFVLAMPATLLWVAAGSHTLPEALRARYGGGAVARALCVAALLAGASSLLAFSERQYGRKHFEVGAGADAILAKGPESTSRPALIARTLADLRSRMQPGQTLLVMPEGIILNYWLRRENPTRFDLFLPTEIRAFGEDAMLRDLAAHSPDFVVLVHRFGKEFGVGPFGRDPRNGRALRAWVDAHYRRVAHFGAEPFAGLRFGTLVLERVRAP